MLLILLILLLLIFFVIMFLGRYVPSIFDLFKLLKFSFSFMFDLSLLFDINFLLEGVKSLEFLLLGFKLSEVFCRVISFRLMSVIYDSIRHCCFVKNNFINFISFISSLFFVSNFFKFFSNKEVNNDFNISSFFIFYIIIF